MPSALREAVPALGLSLAGLCLLAAMSLAPRADSALLGLLVPPWMSPAEGLAAAARAAPIVDLRLGGRLIVVVPPDGPGPAGAAWPPPGLVPISAAGGLCRPSAPASGVTR